MYTEGKKAKINIIHNHLFVLRQFDCHRLFVTTFFVRSIQRATGTRDY